MPKSLLIRTITGLSFALVMILATITNEYTYGALFLIVTIISTFEYLKIIGIDDSQSGIRSLLIGTNVLVFLLGFFIAINWLPGNYRIFGIIPVFFLFMSALVGKSAPDYRLASILISGHMYIGIPLMLLSYIYIHKNDFWPSYVIAILCFVWCNDAGAYLIGSAFGKHKMIPKVSPGKTWEGFWGGIATAALSGFIFSKFSPNLSTHQWIFMSVIVAFGGSFGDLIGSALKRTFGVKDSGSFFPGHGGFIDRFDSFFIAIVFAFVYLSLIDVIIYT